MTSKAIKLDWNPLFLKELRVQLRDGRNLRRGWWGALFLSIPAIALLALQVAFPGPLSRIGRYVIIGYGVLQNLTALAGVALAATGIVNEREKNTYEVLQASPISPERLFLGKMLYSFYVVAVRQVALLVPMSIVYLSGGFPFHILLLYVAVLFATDLFIAALGLFISAQPHRIPKIAFAAFKQSATRTQVAMQKAMGISVLFLILLPFYAVLIPTIAGAATAGRGGGRPGPFDGLSDLSLLGTICPAVTLAFWGDVDLFGRPVPLWAVAIVCNLLLAAMFFYFGVGLLRGRERDTSVGGRTCLAVFLLLLFAVMVGNVGQRPGFGPFVVAGLVAVIFLIILTPCLAVGELTRAERKGFLTEMGKRSLSPRGLFRPRVTTAAAWILLIALLSAPLLWLSLGSETLPCLGTILVCSLGLASIGHRISRAHREGAPGRVGLALGTLLLFVFTTLVPTLLHAASEAATDPSVRDLCHRGMKLLLPLSPIATVELRLMTTAGSDVSALDPIRMVMGGFAQYAWIASCGWYALFGLLAAVWPLKKEATVSAKAQPAGTARA